MWLLLSISLLLALFVVLPKAIHAMGDRAVCPQCRYSLSGLPATGTCPECASTYDKATIIRVGWELRWRMVPRMALAMLVPALGPTLFISFYCTILQRKYGWPWEVAWFQATERELLGVSALLSLPLLANSWFLIALPYINAQGRWALRDRIERPWFWLRFIVTSFIGIAGVGSMGFIPWLHRVRFDALWLLLPGFAFLCGILVCVHVFIDMWTSPKRKHQPSQPAPAKRPEWVRRLEQPAEDSTP